MRKNKEERKEYHREYMRKKRQGLTEGFNKTPEKEEGLTSYPDILYKLTDKVKWRPALEKICQSFKVSHHPDYIYDCTLGFNNLGKVCELLEVTG